MVVVVYIEYIILSHDTFTVNQINLLLDNNTPMPDQGHFYYQRRQQTSYVIHAQRCTHSIYYLKYYRKLYRKHAAQGGMLTHNMEQS